MLRSDTRILTTHAGSSPPLPSGTRNASSPAPIDTAAGLGEVAAEVAWEKLRALRAGAELATRRLFEHSPTRAGSP